MYTARGRIKPDLVHRVLYNQSCTCKAERMTAHALRPKLLTSVLYPCLSLLLAPLTDTNGWSGTGDASCALRYASQLLDNSSSHNIDFRKGVVMHRQGQKHHIRWPWTIF